MADLSLPAVPSASSLLAEGRLASFAERDAAEVGQQFESLFLSLILKQMRQTAGGEGLFPGDKSDSFGAMFDQYMGEAIAENGGLGLAAYVEQSLRKADDQPPRQSPP